MFVSQITSRVRGGEVVSHIDGFVTRVAPTWPRSRGPVNFESALFRFTKFKNIVIGNRV